MIQLKRNPEKAEKKPPFILMCAGCGRIHISGKKWHRVRALPAQKTLADISHGLCPACFARHYPDFS
jgi:hypothetical protein